MAQLSVSTRRRLARGLNRMHVAALANRNFMGLGNRATLTTAQGTNKNLTFYAKTAGVGGNATSIRFVAPGTASAALSVTVAGSAITVNLATNAGSVVTSTAKQVKDAVLYSGPASNLVHAQDAAASDGTGVVAALAVTNLAGATARGAY